MQEVRLIDANALAVSDMAKLIDQYLSDQCNLTVGLAAALMPEIEAEPVRHGRWNYRHEDDWCYCTACGTDAEGSDGECLETDYCPHCGARMDGGDGND